MYSIDVSYMLNKTTGIIKIRRFSGTTYKEFMAALHNLVEEHELKNLIIDLRENTGGYLEAATKILDQLFPANKLLVYTEGRSYRRKDYYSTGKASFNIEKVAVLIDENSASASEIMAGAIQDNDRGLIIGRRSFGKGLVQEQYKLTDGSALRLTVARYFTPSGRYIQKPYDGSEGSYHDDLRHRYESGELYSKDSIHISDSTIYRTTSGRIVHGGGGIIPDIFIPLDTALQNAYMLTTLSYLRDFTYKYLDNKRDQLAEKYPTLEDFEKNYSVSNQVLDQFIAYTESKKIQRNSKLLQQNKAYYTRYIKANIADQLFKEIGYFKTLFSDDKMVLRAIQEINRDGSVSKPSAMNAK